MNMTDTEKLLTECVGGVKMGISALKDIEAKTEDPGLSSVLKRCIKEHQDIAVRADSMLRRENHTDGNAMAKSMAWLKTNVVMAVSPHDSTAASLSFDGCNMGVKAISKALNECPDASDKAKKLARDFIALEERTAAELKKYV